MYICIYTQIYMIDVHIPVSSEECQGAKDF